MTYVYFRFIRAWGQISAKENAVAEWVDPFFGMTENFAALKIKIISLLRKVLSDILVASGYRHRTLPHILMIIKLGLSLSKGVVGHEEVEM